MQAGNWAPSSSLADPAWSSSAALWVSDRAVDGHVSQMTTMRASRWLLRARQLLLLTLVLLAIYWIWKVVDFVRKNASVKQQFLSPPKKKVQEKLHRKREGKYGMCGGARLPFIEICCTFYSLWQDGTQIGQLLAQVMSRSKGFSTGTLPQPALQNRCLIHRHRRQWVVVRNGEAEACELVVSVFSGWNVVIVLDTTENPGYRWSRTQTLSRLLSFNGASFIVSKACSSYRSPRCQYQFVHPEISVNQAFLIASLLAIQVWESSLLKECTFRVALWVVLMII